MIPTLQTTPKGPDVYDLSTVVFVTSCNKYLDRVQSCRSTWVKQLKDLGVKVYFVLGDPTQLKEFSIQGDILSVKCGDTYKDLPAKTMLIAKYFLQNYTTCKYMFKCDDDTYIHADNFIKFDKENNDYIGRRLREGVASGGAGYFLSRKSASIIASSNFKKGAEDVLVGETLTKSNIKLVDNKRFIAWPTKWGQSKSWKGPKTRGDIPPAYNTLKDHVTDHLFRADPKSMYTFHSNIKAKNTTKVLLLGGFGNRLNNILNYADRLDTVTFICPLDGFVKWHELFSSPQINIVYDKGRNHPGAAYAWAFQHANNDSKIKAARAFIKSLKPSKAVAELILDIPKGVDGYHLRLLHPRTLTKDVIHIPNGSFMATDSEKQQLSNPNTLQSKGTGGHSDHDSNIRGLKGTTRAVADWFSLFKCETIYEIGLPFDNYMDTTHSTFLDAHRILQKNIINETNKHLKDTK